MAQRRKLQVFVSSTYTDLINERQAAVEAILTAGHIPAGMELFTGQNEEQMNIIKRWIDKSDLYMLLLGGRYGSIEEVSGKSYTHLEFDYAKSLSKTVFVVVASDDYIEQKVKKRGTKAIIEREHQTEYLNFKKNITGKFVKHWNSLPTLQLAIINALHELEDDETLVGWVRGSEAIDSGVIAEQIARLTKENADLTTQLAIANKSQNTVHYNGLTFEQTCSLLDQFKIDADDLDIIDKNILDVILKTFGEKKLSLLHVFYTMKPGLNYKMSLVDVPNSRQWIIHKLVEFNLLILTNKVYTVSTDGYQFGLRLQVEYNTKYKEKFLELHPGLAAHLVD